MKSIFPPGLEHNKYKVGAVTLTLTRKVSSAEVRAENRIIFLCLCSWSGSVSKHIVFIYFFFFSIPLGKVEVSEDFLFLFSSERWEAGERRSHSLAVLWECAATSMRALCQQTFCGRQERSLAL